MDIEKNKKGDFMAKDWMTGVLVGAVVVVVAMVGLFMITQPAQKAQLVTSTTVLPSGETVSASACPSDGNVNLNYRIFSGTNTSKASTRLNTTSYIYYGSSFTAQTTAAATVADVSYIQRTDLECNKDVTFKFALGGFTEASLVPIASDTIKEVKGDSASRAAISADGSEVTITHGTNDIFIDIYVNENKPLQAKGYDTLNNFLNQTDTNTGYKALASTTVLTFGDIGTTATLDISTKPSGTWEYKVWANVNESNREWFSSSQGLYLCRDYDTTKWDEPSVSLDTIALSFVDTSSAFPAGWTTTSISATYEKCAKIPSLYSSDATKGAGIKDSNTHTFFVRDKALAGVDPANSDIAYAIYMGGKYLSIDGSTMKAGAVKDDTLQTVVQMISKWKTDYA